MTIPFRETTVEALAPASPPLLCLLTALRGVAWPLLLGTVGDKLVFQGSCLYVRPLTVPGHHKIPGTFYNNHIRLLQGSKANFSKVLTALPDTWWMRSKEELLLLHPLCPVCSSHLPRGDSEHACSTRCHPRQVPG